MQTVKTVAIVFLLMSVIYGAYISLTTPPEPLPAGIEDMLAADGNGLGSLDSGLPPSLAELGVDEGQLAGGQGATGNAITQPADQSVAAFEGPGSDALGFSTPVESLSAPGTSAAPVESATPNALASFSTAAGQADSSVPHFDLNNDSGVSASLSDSSFGNKAVAAAGQSAAPNYPQTGSVFTMPNPDAAIADLSQSNTDTGVSQVAAISGGPDANLGLSNAIRTADAQFENDQRREALATLSIFYSSPNLSGEQRSELLSRLDPLAADVIYSREHLLERPYRVGQDETLMEVAARYEVPWQLLANINQVRDPVAVVPGTELKVVRGPFRAEVSLATNELTLFLGDLYAGRFPIGVGHDPAPSVGTYTVLDKQASRTYYDASGSPVPAGSPANPYGNAWIDLGNEMCIHGSPNTVQPTNKGCISLAADHADDLFGILSHGSAVIVR